MSNLARELEYDREISRTHYEQVQDEVISNVLEAVTVTWTREYEYRFDRLMATRAAAQAVIDACNCALYDKFK